MTSPFKVSNVTFDKKGGVIYDHLEFNSMSELCKWMREEKNKLVEMDNHLPKFSMLVKRDLDRLEELYTKASDHFYGLETDPEILGST
jgi:hypothetical protein